MSNLLNPKTTPQWIKITKTFEDFSTAGFTNDIEIYSLPAKGVVHARFIYPTTTFSGGLIATYTISVGIAGNFTKYGAAINVFTGAVLGTSTPLADVENMSSSTSIRAQAISTVGNLDTAVQGSVDIYLLVSNLE